MNIKRYYIWIALLCVLLLFASCGYENDPPKETPEGTSFDSDLDDSFGDLYDTETENNKCTNDHNYGEWVITQSPTCTERGLRDRFCADCGIGQAEYMDPTGHTEVIDRSVEPTCTEVGFTEGIHCSVCDKVIIAQEIIKVNGHTTIIDEAVEPTCTKAGLTSGAHCSVCSEVLVAQTTIEATGHTEVIDNAVEPTCTETGLTEGKHCSICNEVLVAQTTVEANGHKFGEWTEVQSPTCTESGSERRDCENCDYFETRETDTTGHIFGGWEEVVAPTCTEKGIVRRECDNCEHFESIDIAEKGHTEVIDNAVEPTCTQTGLTEGKRCSACKEVLVAQNELPIIPHTYDDKYDDTCNECGAIRDAECAHSNATIILGKSPSCTETGLTDGSKCSRCGEILVSQKVISATGHTEIVDKALEPTCTETGLTEGKHCSICNEVLVAQTTVEANGHKFGEWTEVQAPTCTESGSERRDCEKCDHFETKDIAEKGHTEIIDKALEPTCTETGLTEGKHCSICNEVLVAQTTVEANGHKFGEWTEVQAPTCTESGSERRDCENCDHFETKDIAEKGHTEIVDKALEPTCTETGLTEGKHCSICNEVLVAQTTVEANGHKFGEWTEVQAPTCTESGSERRDCEKCDHFETRAKASPGHIYTSVVTKPTALAEGYTTHTCGGCGDSYVDSYVPATGSLGLTYAVNADNKSCTVTGMGSCNDSSVYIPKKHNGYTVTAIGNGAFSNRSSISEIFIPDTVASIGKEAFRGCSGISTITIPNSVTALGEYVFSECNSLHTVYMSESVSMIPNSAFAFCASLNIINIPNSCTVIGESAFYSCPCLLDINIPNSVALIGSYAFGHCGLMSVVIPSSITEIEDFAFVCCENLRDFSIPNSVVSVENGAFEGCIMLENIYIPDSVTGIGAQAFKNCISLVSVTIPNSVASIGSNIFNGCTKLSSVTIPDSVKSIGSSSFYDCTDLKSVTIGNGVESIDRSVFYNCESLISITIPDSVTSIGDCAFYGCTDLKSVTIGNSVESIGKDVFHDCISLTNIALPDSVTSIGDYAFFGCTNLQDLTISDNLTSIGAYAFYTCRGLTDITVPDSVTSIGEGAFYGCTGLQSITVPFVGATKDIYSVKWFGYFFGASSFSYNYDYVPPSLKKVIITGGNHIDEFAFAGCTSLRDITISDGVTSIGAYAFYTCRGLTDITVPDSVTSIGEGAFYGCTGLQSITLPSGITSIGDHEFYNCTSLTSIIIPDSVTSIGDYAFYGCTDLKSVTIGNNVESIGKDVFHDCISLTSITLPNSVTSIGDYAFFGCTNLQDIAISDNLMSIGTYAFYTCKSLKSITLPDSVTSIGESVFSGCAMLEELTLPFVGTKLEFEKYRPYYVLGVLFGQESYTGGVATLQYYDYYNSQAYNTYYIPESLHSVTVNGGAIRFGAFYNCKNIKNITFGDSVTGVANDAFYNCSGLEAVHTTNIANWCGINFANEYAQPLYYADEFYVNGVLATDIEIPEGVSTIGIRAFYKCKTIENIKISGSVTIVMNSAFEYCTSLRSVTLEEGTEGIGSSAFKNCSLLYRIILPSSVKGIGEYAFRYNGYFSIYYESDANSWEDVSIGSYSGMENVSMYYYSEAQPSNTTYKYWHYVDGEPTPW